MLLQQFWVLQLPLIFGSSYLSRNWSSFSDSLIQFEHFKGALLVKKKKAKTTKRRPTLRLKRVGRPQLSKKILKNVEKLKNLLKKDRRKDSTFFGDREFSIFLPIKKNMLRLMKKQLSRFYLHIGLQKNQTHQGFRPLLSGYYRESSLINMNFLVYYFRRLFKFLMLLMLRNYRFCFVSHQIRQYFEKKIFLFRYHMIYDYWIPGTVSNYIILSKQTVRKQAKFIRRFPQGLIAMKLDLPKFYSILKEANNAGLPMFSFLDTDVDISLFNYFFPLNLHNFTSYNYCLFLINSLIKRSLLVKKTKFMNKKKKNVSKKNKAK